MYHEVLRSGLGRTSTSPFVAGRHPTAHTKAKRMVLAVSFLLAVGVEPADEAAG